MRRVLLVVGLLVVVWNLVWHSAVVQRVVSRDVSRDVSVDQSSPTATARSWFAVTPENDARAIADRVEAEESAWRERLLPEQPKPSDMEPARQREGGLARAERLSQPRVSGNRNAGGTLHRATGRQWLAASSRNRLDTAADFVVRFWREDGYPADLIDQMRREGGLRAAAERQVACVTRMLNNSGLEDATVAIAASVCYQTN